jgi:hypothetical protein
MANGDRGDDWPVCDEQGNWTYVDARTYLAWWVRNESDQSTEFKVAIDALVVAGCDQLKLAWLLSCLPCALQLRNISRECVRESAENLDRAADAVRRLFFSQLGRVLGLDTLRLEGELQELAKQLKKLAPHLGGHPKPAIDRQLKAGHSR